jgi:hypothetical protein
LITPAPSNWSYEIGLAKAVLIVSLVPRSSWACRYEKRVMTCVFSPGRNVAPSTAPPLVWFSLSNRL